MVARAWVLSPKRPQWEWRQTLNLRASAGTYRAFPVRTHRDGGRDASPATSRARSSPDGAAKVTRSILAPENLPLALLALLIGRAMVLQTISPFGLAFFAAVLALAPRRAAAAGLAVAAGIFSAGAAQALLEFLGSALGLGLLFLAFERQGRPRKTGPLTLAALAFTVTLLAASAKALLVDPTPYRFLMAFFSGLLTFVLTVVYLTALPVLLSVRRVVALGPEQVIMVAITGATALAGLSGVGYAGLRLSGVAGGVLVLLSAATCGAGVGAAVGTVAGVVSSLCGTGGLSSVGLAALSGLLAGAFREFGRLGLAAGFFCGALLLSPLVEEAVFLQAVVAEAALSAAVFLVIPERVLGPLRTALSTTAGGLVTEPAEDSARQHVGKRLIDFSLVFGQLASTLRELSATSAPPGLQGCDPGASPATPVNPPTANTPPAGPSAASGSAVSGLADVASRVCQSCRLFRACWRADSGRARAAMAALLEVTAESGQLETRDIPLQIRRRCVHLGELVTTMNFLHEIAALNRHWRKKLDDSRAVVCQQLDGLAHILKGLGEQLRTEAADHARAAADLSRQLALAGFWVREVVATRVPDGKIQFMVRADCCEQGNACREVALPVASAFSGHELDVTGVSCGLAAGRDECAFYLSVPRQLDFKMGVAQARKSPSGVSGDSYLIRELPGNRLAAVLSDGPGAGPRAAEESRSIVKMLEELFRLGFDTEMAVRTVNSMLLLRSGQERFATLDLLTADLHSGQTRFVKIGAPPSYLRRGRDVTVINSSNLPLGVLPEVSTEGHVLTVAPGDLVVLATDGLMSPSAERGGSLSPDDGWIVSLLRDAGEAGPQDIADALVQAAVSTAGARLPAVAGGTPVFAGLRGLRDDVTVLALRFGPFEGA